MLGLRPQPVNQQPVQSEKCKASRSERPKDFFLQLSRQSETPKFNTSEQVKDFLNKLSRHSEGRCSRLDLGPMASSRRPRSIG